MIEILEKEGLAEYYNSEAVQKYLLKRTARIESARKSAVQFFEGKSPERIKADLGTALAGIVGLGGKAVILGADGQTTWGYQKIMGTEKIYEIDKYTLVAGTGVVAFIQDIVKIFETDIYFLQALRNDGTFISPSGKANLLSSLVKSIIALALYFDMGAGFLLGMYNPKDNEARLFQISPLGSISEDKILADGCGKDWVLSTLDEYYEKWNMTRKNLLKLAEKAIKKAIKHDVYCGGKPTFHLANKNGARRVK